MGMILKISSVMFGTGVLLCFVSDETAQTLQQNWLLFLGGTGLAVVFFSWLVKAERANAKKRQKELEEIKLRYETTLTFLQTRPEDPQARISCLEAGRLYYGITMPDTHTVHYRNGIPVGTSDQQDNSAGREARINSDIEARIGHLKFKKTG